MGMLLPAWAALGAAAAAAAPPSVDVFTPGMRSTAGVAYSCIRIPSVVLDPPSGHLLAFAECRAWVGDGCEPAKPQGSGRGTDLCSRVSRDHGASWGVLTTLATNAGQPTATFDRVKNRTILEFNSKSGPGCGSGRGASCCPVFQMTTADGGATVLPPHARPCPSAWLPCPPLPLCGRASDPARWPAQWSNATAVEPTPSAVAWPARVGPGRGIQLRKDNPHSPVRIPRPCLSCCMPAIEPPSFASALVRRV